jgi:hypothetical protein
MASYRVKMKVPFGGYNAGETAYCASTTAQALVTAGVATAIDALPATTVTPTVLGGVPARAHVHLQHALVPRPVLTADSDLNQSETAVYAGGAGG